MRSRARRRRNPTSLSKNQKTALAAAGGLAVIAGVLLLTATKASAATGGGGTSPTGLSPTDGGRGQAATALAAAIQSGGGYCGSQSALAGQYQAQAGLSVDGFPGTNTMNALRADLATMGNASAYPLVGTLTLYPWTGAAGWTSNNVPTAFVNNAAAWTAGTTCSQ